MNDEHNNEPVEETPVTEEQPKATRSKLLTRREMIALLVGSGVTMATAAVLANPLDQIARPALEEARGHAEGDSRFHWVMVIDLNRCVGCDFCVYACQATNDTREDMRWNIRLVDETPTGNIFHLTRPCLHCNNAPCVEVCPVAATYHRADGLVVMDYDRCIGCRYCQTACPYGVRQFNWEERTDEGNPVVPDFGRPEVPRRPRGVVEKCTFCIHRIDAALENGLMPGVDREATPACVNICPVTARWFGDLNDPNSEVSRIIAEQPTLRLREDLGTEPNVYYLPPEGLVL